MPPPNNRRPSGRETNLGPERTGDPLAPAVGRTGATWTNPAPNLREHARIVSVNPANRSYRCVTLSGRAVTALRLQASPHDDEIWQIGTNVRIDWSLGYPYIDGVLPSNNAQPDPDSERVDNPTGTDGFGNDPAFDVNHGAQGRPPGAPTDVLPGDFVRRSPDGASIGAYHGRLAMLFGGHMAQLLAFGEQDRVELVAGVLRILTWMGESKIENVGGRTSFIWRGGADQLTETGPDEERYTIHLDVGATGNLVNFRVTTLDQQTVFSAHVTREGRIELYGAAGVHAAFLDQESAGHQIRYDGPVDTQIEGERTEHVGGNSAQTITGAETHEVSNNVVFRVGNDWSLTINRNSENSVGGNRSEHVVGDDTKTVGQSESTTVTGNSTETITGSKTVTSTADLALTSNSGSIRLTCQSADMSLDAGGNVVSIACRGVEIAGSTDNAVLYTVLQSILSTFITNYAAHTHAVSGAVASPPVDGTLTLINQLSQMRSQKLKLGG